MCILSSDCQNPRPVLRDDRILEALIQSGQPAPSYGHRAVPTQGDHHEITFHPAADPGRPQALSQAPQILAGFTDTFTSRYIDTGELRLHAVIGGGGPPLLVARARIAVQWRKAWLLRAHEGSSRQSPKR